MIQLGEIELVSGGYVPTVKRTEVWDQFNRSVSGLLSSGLQDKWNIAHADDVAACYVSSYPAWSHEKFEDFLRVPRKNFIDSLFWFDDILAYVIAHEHLSPKFYSKKKGIDVNLLKDGWNKCFGETELLVFSAAIDPRKFLQFLTSHTGKALANNHLSDSWGHVLEEARKKQMELEHSEDTKKGGR
jgi:hypothetical protein